MKNEPNRNRRATPTGQSTNDGTARRATAASRSANDGKTKHAYSKQRVATSGTAEHAYRKKPSSAKPTSFRGGHTTPSQFSNQAAQTHTGQKKMSAPPSKSPWIASAKTNQRASRTSFGQNIYGSAPGYYGKSSGTHGKPSGMSGKPSGFSRKQKRRRIVALLVVVVFLALLAGVVRNCTSNADKYDWNNLDTATERYAYSENGTVVSRVGIDVAQWQEDIDWKAVAADGIEFAFIRIGSRGYTQGSLMEDTKFIQNYDGATAAGLDVGVYFFSQALTVAEAEEEASAVLAWLDGRKLDLPIAFDFELVGGAEGRANMLDGVTLSKCANAFCKAIEKAGYDTCIYGSNKDLSRYQEKTLDDWDIWLAEYEVSFPTSSTEFFMWQYSCEGHVDGIETLVDLNLMF